MNITTARYSGHESIGIVIVATIDGQELTVPMVEGNRHYDAIKELVDAGELVIEPVDMTEPSE